MFKPKPTKLLIGDLNMLTRKHFIKKANAVSINVAVNQIEEIIEDNTKIILKAIQKACN